MKNFYYHLPQNLIAQKPASPRDSCRLMVIKRERDAIVDRHFYDLPEFLKPGDVLIFNNSKVIPARILFDHNGKKCELFLITKKDEKRWFAIGKPGKMLQKGVRFTLHKELSCTIEEIVEDGQKVVLFSQMGAKLDELLNHIGQAPFPPYIKKPLASFSDYQTIYAKKKGSVAAPTAGLHFTHSLLTKLENKGIQMEYITLHVGLGTFLPIKTSQIENHHMHREFFSIDHGTAKRLQKAIEEKRKLIAVGTTSVRVLETAWHQGTFKPGLQETDIYIYPGYQWQCVNGLITNFHLPQSTLILLTCSFGGKELIMKAYQKAVQKHYRFYSFGDAMFIS